MSIDKSLPQERLLDFHHAPRLVILDFAFASQLRLALAQVAQTFLIFSLDADAVFFPLFGHEILFGLTGRPLAFHRFVVVGCGQGGLAGQREQDSEDEWLHVM